MNKGKVTFKDYKMNQPSLLPPSLEEFIPAGYLVRAVDQKQDVIRYCTLQMARLAGENG